MNARYPGARHDAYIWNVSAARRVMERAYNRGERRTYLIGHFHFPFYFRVYCLLEAANVKVNILFVHTGDSGYPVEPWLLTPLPREPEGTPRFTYNEALCKARTCVERLFGVLKAT